MSLPFVRTEAFEQYVQMNYIQLRKDVWVLQVVDDCSRFIIAAKVTWSPHGKETIQLLKECISNFGTPKQFSDRPRNQLYRSKVARAPSISSARNGAFNTSWNRSHTLKRWARPSSGTI